VANAVGYDFELLSAVMAVNEGQRERFVDKVREALWTLRGKRLAVLGLAFKGGTDDIRDSPSLDIVKRLAEEGAFIVAYDPVAMARAASHLSECLTSLLPRASTSLRRIGRRTDTHGMARI